MMETLRQYGPRLPLPDLVAELNQLYHQKEAPDYEATHPEIFHQLPPLWAEMLAKFDRLHNCPTVKILDYGCGTGFEARQCMYHFGPLRVARMVCYDPSPEMLGRCRETLRVFNSNIVFTGDLASFAENQFDLLITNSVLHHLVEPVQSIRELSRLLTTDAVWVSGHEPSRRFLENPECRKAFGRYLREHRWRRFLSPASYRSRLLRRRRQLPEQYAADRSVQRALFSAKPPASLIRKLVDYHVVHRESDIEASRGLDFEELQAAFSGEWKLLSARTYSFMGHFYEPRLPRRWQRCATQLAQRFPDAGANTALVWQRCNKATH